MKIPGWSAMVIAPVIIGAASFNVIRQSETPVVLGLIVASASLVVGLLAWGLLHLLDRGKRT